VAKQKVKNSSLFAQHLASLMREHRLKHRQLAEVAGVSKAAVGKWLRGTMPGAGEVFKIARALNIPMEYFFQAIEDLPASEAEKAILRTFPEQIPADKIRSAAAPLGLANPKTIERILDLKTNYRQVLEQKPDGTLRMYYEPILPSERSEEKTSKQVLTNASESVIYAPMKSELQELLVAARRLTKSRGMKTRLAKALCVPLPRVSDWLAGNYLPSGQRALALREWVQQQEAQQKQNPGSVSAPPGPKTQSKASNEKKPKSSPQER
jgi:transcriptional regulator with XRE-family HTH domain